MKIKYSLLILVTFFNSCISDTERAEAEAKLVEDGILKSDEEIAAEEKTKKLLIGNWQTVKAKFINSGEVLTYSATYNDYEDYVETLEFDDNSTLKIEIKDDYYTAHPQESNISEYVYEIYGSNLSTEIMDKGAPSGTVYFYEIITLTKDSLIMKNTGKKLKNTDFITEEDPYISFHTKIRR